MQKIKFTYEDYLQLSEDKRYELLEGELFMVPSPVPSHQNILQNLLLILDAHIRAWGLGQVYLAPLDVVLSPEDVLQPDILFIAKDRLGIIGEKNIQGAPDLVIEILSPATAERDRGLKRRIYARYGVKEYWLVDADRETIEVLEPGKADLESTGVYGKKTGVKSNLLPGLSFTPEQVL